MYGFWDIRHDEQGFLSFWAVFCLLTFLTTRKIKILKKWKKHLKLLSFYSCVPQITIICRYGSCTAVQIIQIWKWKQNVWQKPCHIWILISPEQKMVETSCKKKLKSRRIIEHTDYFYFTQIPDKNLQISFKNWRFSTFTTFSLHWWSSVDAGTKQSFCF